MLKRWSASAESVAAEGGEVTADKWQRQATNQAGFSSPAAVFSTSRAQPPVAGPSLRLHGEALLPEPVLLSTQSQTVTCG